MEWIKTNDRLPELNKTVLIVDRGGDVIVAWLTEIRIKKKVVDINWITMYHNCCDPDERGQYEIVYWAEIPTKPKD